MKQQAITFIGIVVLFIAGCGPPSNTSLMKKGNHAMWQGRWADAAAHYDKAVTQHPGDWEAQYYLGQCLLELDDPQGASQALAIAESLRPQNIEVSDLLADALFRVGDRDHLFNFLHTRAKKQQTVRAWVRLAEYAMALDDPDSATNAINTAIAIDDGTDATPFMIAATFAERLGDDALAVSRWRQAWHIDPNNQDISSALRSHGEIPGPTMSGITDDQ